MRSTVCDSVHMKACSPRSARDSGDDFPYTSKKVCYIEVLKDGKAQQGLS